MFAGDVVLFAKVDHGNCVAIRDALDTFCSRTGQTISEAKSRVFFSPNVYRDSREALCGVLGFASTPNSGKYLRIPIKLLMGRLWGTQEVLVEVVLFVTGLRDGWLDFLGRLAFRQVYWLNYGPFVTV